MNEDIEWSAGSEWRGRLYYWWWMKQVLLDLFAERLGIPLADEPIVVDSKETHT